MPMFILGILQIIILSVNQFYLNYAFNLQHHMLVLAFLGPGAQAGPE